MQKNGLKKALFGACLLFLTGNLAAQINQFNFNYGTGLTTTATTISFGYNLNVINQAPDPNHPGSGGNLYGRVFLDGGAAGNYFVGEFHHKYNWSIVSTNTSLNTITLYTPGYPTISGNPLAEQTPVVTNTPSATPSVTLTVPTGCIPNGTYAIRVDMYSFTMPPSEFPNGAFTKFTIGSTVTFPTMLNFGWSVLAGYAGSGNIGTFTVSSGSGLTASAVVTSGTCTSNGSIAVTPSGGTSPYTLYYKKLNGTANTAGSGSSTITATNLQSGATYDVAIVDANGCRWEDRIVMPVPAAPTISVTPASQTVCKATCVTFSVSASPGTGYSYSWTHSNSNTPTHQISTANYFCTTVPGIANQSSTVNTYIVTATNGYCTGSATRIMTTNNSCIPATGNCCSPPPRSSEPGNEGDVSANIYLEVYPNPTSGTLTVSFEGLDRTGVVAEIFDAAGKRMLAENITDGSSRIDLNVSELPSGVYIVRFVANGEQLMSRSFVRE